LEQGSFMDRLSLILALAALTLLGGCAEFQTGRSFLSEMEHDDSSFYSPEKDFPVVAGDSGDMGMSAEDYRARTPASEREREYEQDRSSLKSELRRLEESQSESALNFYNKHKHKLVTSSERIYFLKLPRHERHEYMDSRGFLDTAAPSASDISSRISAVRDSSIQLGMSKSDVVNSWGRPSRVEVAGNPSYENERWVYSMNGASKYIYFEAGSVQGWE
jgi:hypothetical protein